MTDTNREAQHTALPWVVEEGHIQRDSNGIRYWQITDKHDAIACNQFCYANYNPAVNAANAAFIVRVCNSHYQLVSVLQELADVLEHDCDCPPCVGSMAPAEHALGLARDILAALSHAGGASE